MKLFRVWISSILVLLTLSFPAFSAQFKKGRTIGSEEFMFLCESGSAEEISKALKNGASAGISYTDGTTTLMVAAKSNIPEAVKVLLDAGVNVNAKNSDGNTALLMAAQFNYDPDVIDTLIDAGADDASNKNAETALMLAARYNNPEVVLTLVKAGADETAKSRTGETALSIAQKRGDYDVINALFDFQELCRTGSAEELLKAIQTGAIVNMKYDMDYTPLMIAAAVNSAEAVEALIKSGANVCNISIGDEEETALSLAVKQNSLDVINVLLNANADTLRTVYFYDDEKGDFSQKTIIDLASENEKLKGTDAIKILKSKMEEQSNPENQVKLGFLYYNGKGIVNDNDEAFKWFQRAADQGNSQGQYVLALFYRDGIGVKKDENEYMRFLRMAADNGNTSAQVLLGKVFAVPFENKFIITTDREKLIQYIREVLPAFHYYYMAVEKGNADAQFELAKLYASINSGQHLDFARDIARIFSRHVSDDSHAWLNEKDEKTLQEFLNVLSLDEFSVDAYKAKYRKEYSMNVDFKVLFPLANEIRGNASTLAVKWFREAARQGHKEAQNALKEMKETW